MMSEKVKRVLNTRFRRGNRSELRETNKFIIDTIKDRYNIDVEFDIANLEQRIVELNGLKVTQAYNNYEQWLNLYTRK